MSTKQENATEYEKFRETASDAGFTYWQAEWMWNHLEKKEKNDAQNNPSN